MIEIRQQSWRKMERILAQFSVDVGNIIYLIDDETHTWIKKIILELLESSSDMKETTQEVQKCMIDTSTKIRLLAYAATFANWHIDTYYAKWRKDAAPKTILKERLDFVRQQYEKYLLFIKENSHTEQDVNWKSKFEHFWSNALCSLELCNY